jgi:hypothetical protein
VIQYSDQISSADLNRRFEEIYLLLSEAYRHNQKLMRQVQAQELAIKAMPASVSAASASAGSFLADQGFVYSGGDERVAAMIYGSDVVYLHQTRIEPYSHSLYLAAMRESSRIPLDDNGNLAEMVSVTINNGAIADPAVRWILEPDKFWCFAHNENHLTIQIQLPPSLHSEVNTVALQHLFPSGNYHRIGFVDISGNTHQLSKLDVSKSSLYTLEGRRFGGQITINLRSSLQVDGKYIFGLRGLQLSNALNYENGYAIVKVTLPHSNNGDMDLRSINAAFNLPAAVSKLSSAVRFEIGTSYNAATHSIGGIVYDSSKDPFPLKTSDPALPLNNVPNTVYIKTTLYNHSASPVVEGLYFSFNEA